MTNAAYVAEELRVKAAVANTRRRKPHVDERYRLQNCLSPWLHFSATPPSSTSSPSCTMSHHAAALQLHAAVVNVIAVVHYVTP
jgi:hypothetical protein